jgi:hypothetical protein
MNEQTTTNTAAHDEPLAVLPPVDDDAAGREAVREKMADALTPGFQVEFDPDEAERVGAFVEDALSEQDAAASGDDLVEVDGALEPAFLDDEGPSADTPAVHHHHERPRAVRPAARRDGSPRPPRARRRRADPCRSRKPRRKG